MGAAALSECSGLAALKSLAAFAASLRIQSCEHCEDLGHEECCEQHHSKTSALLQAVPSESAL